MTSAPRCPRSKTEERTRDLPVAAVGICAGGGYMARAVADDQRICAFAGVAGYYSDAAAFATASPGSIERRSTEGSPLSNTGERPAKPRPSRRSRRTVGTWRCRFARRTSSTARRAVRWTTTRTASPSSRSRTRRRSMPRRPRPGSRRRSCSIHSEHALAPPLARKFYAAVTHAQVGALVGVAGSDRLLRRPSPHRPCR